MAQSEIPQLVGVRWSVLCGLPLAWSTAACQPAECRAGFALGEDGLCYQEASTCVEGFELGEDGLCYERVAVDEAPDDTGEADESPEGDDTGEGAPYEGAVIRVEGELTFDGELSAGAACSLTLWTSEAMALYGGTRPDYEDHEPLYSKLSTCPEETGATGTFGETLHVYGEPEVWLFALVDGDGDPGTVDDFGIGGAEPNPLSTAQSIHEGVVVAVSVIEAPSG